jgi:hypothetical protein
MATELSREELKQLARLGAERRLEELRREEAAIRAAFPDLREARGAGRRKAGRPRASPPSTEGLTTAPTTKRRKRQTMSAAQRRAVSERMKKYWAARRKAKG